jgi:hypothetical protein
MDWVYEFVQGEKPEGLSDAEWEGAKTHLLHDYFNQGAGSTPMSPMEKMVQWIGGTEAREQFQDIKESELILLPAFGLPGFALLDYMAGLLNLSAATHGLEWMISNDVYIRGMREGSPRANVEAGGFDIRGPYVTLRDRRTDKEKLKVNTLGQTETK